MNSTVTIKRVTNESDAGIQQLKKAGIYRPLPDAEHTFTVNAATRKDAYHAGLLDTTLSFSGQQRQIWIDGVQELGNW